MLPIIFTFEKTMKNTHYILFLNYLRQQDFTLVILYYSFISMSMNVFMSISLAAVIFNG
jgi:hypothetical protein